MVVWHVHVHGCIICKEDVVSDVIHVDAFTLGPEQMLQHLNNHLLTLILVLVLKFKIQTFACVWHCSKCIFNELLMAVGKMVLTAFTLYTCRMHNAHVRLTCINRKLVQDWDHKNMHI